MGTIWSLRGSEAFAETRNQARSNRHGRLVVQQVSSQSNAPVVLGLIVSRSVGNAVVRNKVRRRVKSLMREDAVRLVGSTVVVRALPGVDEQTFEQLRLSLRRCLFGHDAQ